MADNYLEKKMEDLRSGRNGATVRRQKKAGALKGLRAFVTGGANGIGKSIVEALRREGCTVAFCDIDKEAGEKLESVYGAKFYCLDVRKSLEFEALFRSLLNEWDDVDIVINNVGKGDFKPLHEKTMKDFEDILVTNLYPVFITGNLLACHREKLKEEGLLKKGGRIINICSSRHLQSEPGSEGYAASKGGIRSLTHALMMSLCRYGITVNCISPGWINTEPGNTFCEADKLQHPSGRIGRPSDIADMVIFLSQPEHDFINGQDIVVDGGMTRRMIYSGDHGWLYSPSE